MPLQLRNRRKGDVRTQFAALPFRIKSGKVQVLMVKTRTSKRWIVPKGWPMNGKRPAHCARIEAWEEAGVRGTEVDLCLGLFSYAKTVTSDQRLTPCVALVYPVWVRELEERYPEAGQRKRKWFTPAKAAKKVKEPELARILRDFDPVALGITGEKSRRSA